MRSKDAKDILIDLSSIHHIISTDLFGFVCIIVLEQAKTSC